MTGGAVEIRRSFDEADRAHLAALLWGAFEAKYARLLRDGGAAAAVLGPGFLVPGTVVAYRDGAPAGVMLLKDRNGLEAMTARVRDYTATYGPISGLLRLGGFSLIDERPQPGVLVLDAIAVDPAARGSGIGSRLIAEAEAVGRERGAQAVVLEVVVENESAIRLYRRLGYRVTRTVMGGWKALLEDIHRGIAGGCCGIMLHHQRMNDRAFRFMEYLLETLLMHRQINMVNFKELLPLKTNR